MIQTSLENIANSLTYDNIFSYIAGLTLAIIALYLFIERRIKTKAETIKGYIDNPADIDKYIEDLKPQVKIERSTYKTFLKKVLLRLDNILGKRQVFSYKAFKRHLIYSLLYSFFFFYVVWLFGGEGKVGEFAFMEKSDRLWTTLLLVFEIIFVYHYLTNEKRIVKFIKTKIPYMSRLNDYYWSEILLVVGLIAAIGATIVGVVGVVGVAIAIVAAIVAGAGAGAGAGLIVVLLVVKGGVNTLAIIYLLFFLILPFINAIFDYISMYASRYFAKRILKDS